MVRMEPEEFLERLNAGEFRNQSVFRGMIKEDGESTIQFALGTMCENWITIPLDVIKSVDVLRTMSCGDHDHPFAQLELKAPETDEGQIYAALLNSASRNRRGSRSNQMREVPPVLLRRRVDDSDVGGSGSAASRCQSELEWCEFLNSLLPEGSAAREDCTHGYVRCLADDLLSVAEGHNIGGAGGHNIFA